VFLHRSKFSGSETKKIPKIYDRMWDQFSSWQAGGSAKQRHRLPRTSFAADQVFTLVVWGDYRDWKWRILGIVIIWRTGILQLRERAASVDWARTSFTPRTELLRHGGGPAPVHKVGGKEERAGREEEMYFRYEELRQICQLAAYASPASH